VTRDCLEIRGLRVLGVHGILREERSRLQPFEIDLDIYLVERPSGADDLASTADYAHAVTVATEVVEKESCRLLEALAEKVAQALLQDPRIAEVTVALRKLRPPIAADLLTAGVRLTRSR
jgi:dihydroneopterin aldolase